VGFSVKGRGKKEKGEAKTLYQFWVTFTISTKKQKQLISSDWNQITDPKRRGSNIEKERPLNT